jgi:hypothetical protein
MVPGTLVRVWVFGQKPEEVIMPLFSKNSIGV